MNSDGTPLYVGEICGKFVRFFRAPVADDISPWVAHQDLGAALGICVQHEIDGYLAVPHSNPGLADHVRSIKTTDGELLQIVSADLAALEIEGLCHAHRAGMGVLGDFVDAVIRATLKSEIAPIKADLATLLEHFPQLRAVVAV